jgi:hypothetical protein
VATNLISVCCLSIPTTLSRNAGADQLVNLSVDLPDLLAQLPLRKQQEILEPDGRTGHGVCSNHPFKDD